VTEDQLKYRGMTLNERLYLAGLLDQFDEALRQRDREGLVVLLEQVEIQGPDAEQTADAVLKSSR
jgi:hypothetical protein